MILLLDYVGTLTTNAFLIVEILTYISFIEGSFLMDTNVLLQLVITAAHPSSKRRKE